MSQPKFSKSTFDRLQRIYEQAEEYIEQKRAAFDAKSEKWQEGDAGQEYEMQIDEMESALGTLQQAIEEIENLT